MAITKKFSSALWRHSLTGSSVQTFSRTNLLTQINSVSGKTSGAVIVLPGGTQFRKATNYAHFESKVQLGAPQNTRGVKRIGANIGSNGWLEVSAGGYYTDIISNATMSSQVTGMSLPFGTDDEPALPTSMRNEAVTKALLDLANGKAGLGEGLGTLGQTIRMLRSPVTTLARGIKALKAQKAMKRFFRESFDSLRRKGIATAASEKYLEYVYGWKPLVQDIYGIVELAKEYGLNDLLLHGKGRSQRSAGLDSFQYRNISGDTYSTFSNGEESCIGYCSIWARVDPEYQALRALNQLGLVNPLALSWELTTLSFLVDWLLPIGPVLNALTAPAGLIFVDGTTSIRTSASGNVNVWGDTIAAPNYSVSLDSVATQLWSYEGYKRSTLASWPAPGLWVDPDPLRLERGGSDRWLKALALAITNLR